MYVGLERLISDLGETSFLSPPRAGEASKDLTNWERHLYTENVHGFKGELGPPVNGPHPNTKIKKPIVLWQSAKTGSAGEQVLIFFSKQKNATSLGQPSGGYATGNNSFQLGAATAAVTGSISVDRNSCIVPIKIPPGYPCEVGDETQLLEKNRENF